MSTGELADIWIATATTMNEGPTDMWALRFVVDGAQLVEQTVKRLGALGVKMRPNGAQSEYLVEFPPPIVREVCAILVDEGASLCADQTLQPVPQ